MPRRFRFPLFFALGAVLLGIFARFPRLFPFGDVAVQKVTGKFTVADRVEKFGPTVEARWKPFFERASLNYPPQKLVLVAFKAEKRLEIYGANADGAWRFVRAFPILRASGKIGPKLREGDLQVPEGLYQVESLNPNSAFHLALRVSYPSDEDKKIAEKEGRNLEELGGNIMIHGGAASIGCLAMGDETAEDLFVLTALAGRENAQIWLCPLDFRTQKVPNDATRPIWVNQRYERLRTLLATLPAS